MNQKQTTKTQEENPSTATRLFTCIIEVEQFVKQADVTSTEEINNNLHRSD